MKISVIIPCYNEENTIIQLLEKVNIQRKNFNLEIIISDDGSKDQTTKLLENNKKLFDKLILGEKNRGKGAALSKAIEHSTGDIIIFQDADLEYDPEDYKKLVEPFVKNEADVVYGSRFMGSSAHRLIYYSHRIANFFITSLVNIFTNINFTDVETGYKVLRRSILEKITIKENSFGVEID